MCCFPEAFILEQSGLNIKSGRPTSKGYNIEADFELKQMWNFKNQETNYKRQRQMMGDWLVQRLADKMRATNFWELCGLYGGTQSLNMFQIKFGYSSSISSGLNCAQHNFLNTPMQLPTTLEFGPFWNVTRVKSSFFFWFCSDKTMRTTWFLRRHTTSLFVPDHILITAWITVLVGFESMNTWCQYGRKMQLNKHDVGYTSFLR